jgi:malonate-semialdehyde dehydrogenase (acetylating)/methylmalonate-semialdehyde dehydrogenase
MCGSMREIPHFIDDAAVAGPSGRFGGVNTGEAQARVPLATEAEVDDSAFAIATMN